jgi:phosphatidate cytidylyltransferase
VSGSPFSTLPARIAVAVVAIPLILYAARHGGWPLFSFAALLTLVGSLEFWRLCGLRSAMRVVGTASALAFPVVAFFWGAAWPFVIPAMVLLVLLSVAARGRVSGAIESAAYTAFGAIYVGGMLSLLVLMRDLPGGRDLLPALFVAVWVCDTAAYFVGVLAGRHKLSPELSPAKTFEGFIGGVIGGVGTFALAVAVGFFKGEPVLFVLALGLIVGVVGQMGDLAESAFKRAAGVKDSSTLIPGHGGVLDRFDSVLAVLPAVAIAVWIRLLV